MFKKEARDKHTVVIADIESLAAKKDVSVVPDTLSGATEIRSSRSEGMNWLYA